MYTIQFNLPDKYKHHQIHIDSLIRKYDGDKMFIPETKDGQPHSIDFQDEVKGEKFNIDLNKLLPDLYEY